MKKLLIGCGILFLLVVGVLGYVAYQIAPTFMDYYDTMTESAVALDELDRTYPYDPDTATEFQPERFELALGLRERILAALTDIPRMIETAESGDMGVFEAVNAVLGTLGATYGSIVTNLSESGMSGSEFSHHMLTYWAAASSAAAGGADAEALAPLVEEYERLRGLYDQVREDAPELEPFEDQLSHVHEALVTGASALLAEHVAVVPRGEEELLLEIILLKISDPEFFMATLEGADGGAPLGPR